jgi:tetratricopeptide (TPR) repeat protein
MSRVSTFLAVPLLLLAALAGAAPPASTVPDDARLQFERGFLRRAASACEQRLAANAHDADAGATLSRIRSTQGDMDGALKLATAAVAADPKNADAQYALAEFYGRKARDAGMLSAAGLAGKMRKAADAALAIDPHHIDALEIDVDFFTMAPGFMGGDKKKAAEYIERLAQVDPVAGWLRGRNAMRAKDSHARRAGARTRRRAAALRSRWCSLPAAQPWRDPARPRSWHCRRCRRSRGAPEAGRCWPRCRTPGARRRAGRPAQRSEAAELHLAPGTGRPPPSPRQGPGPRRELPALPWRRSRDRRLPWAAALAAGAGSRAQGGKPGHRRALTRGRAQPEVEDAKKD